MLKFFVVELCQFFGEELCNKVCELKEELFGLCFQLVIGQFENMVCLCEVCKDIVWVYIVFQECNFNIVDDFDFIKEV